MDNMFMSYGMIVLGVVIIGILSVFAYQSLNKTSIIPTETHQSIAGNSAAVGFRIQKLCEFCMNEEAIDRDCYLLDVELAEGDVKVESLGDSISMIRDLKPGNYVLKIRNHNAVCEVEEIVQ